MPHHALVEPESALPAGPMLRVEQGDAKRRPPAGTVARCGCRAFLHLSGSCAMAIRGVDRVLTGGDLVLVPGGAAPATFRYGHAARRLVLDIDPAGTLGRCLPDGGPVLLDSGSGLGRIASELMRSAYAAQGTLDLRQRTGLHASLEGLLVAALQHGDAMLSAPRLVEQHCTIVKDFMERHLPDPAIDPRRVAAAHRISVRHLHRLFSATGTSFGGWLRARRLERCREDLASAAMKRIGVATIAYRWGFNDAAHFSRLFKRTYGVAPRDYRADATPRLLTSA